MLRPTFLRGGKIFFAAYFAPSFKLMHCLSLSVLLLFLACLPSRRRREAIRARKSNKTERQTEQQSDTQNFSTKNHQTYMRNKFCLKTYKFCLKVIIFFQQNNIQFWGIFQVIRLFQILWPLLYKRAKLDLRSTNQVFLVMTLS